VCDLEQAYLLHDCQVRIELLSRTLSHEPYIYNMSVLVCRLVHVCPVRHVYGNTYTLLHTSSLTHTHARSLSHTHTHTDVKCFSVITITRMSGTLHCTSLRTLFYIHGNTYTHSQNRLSLTHTRYFSLSHTYTHAHTHTHTHTHTRDISL